MNTPQEFAGLMAEKTDQQLRDMFGRRDDWSPQALDAARAELQRRNIRPVVVMELLCPECLGTLESRDGQTARCTTHGGEFEILFARHLFAAPPLDPNAPPVILAEGACCVQHPSVAAAYACKDCGAAICATCDFTQADGSHLCPNCAGRRAVSGPPPIITKPVIASDARCVQHPHLQATARCKTCGAFMCDTCAFDLPGGIKICPTCATAPRSSLSPKRKRFLLGSYAMAVWCTFMMGALFAGAFKGMARTKEDQQALGVFLMLLLLAPSIVGLALAASSMDRRLPNTIAMWIAAVWNALILGGFILLMIAGLLMKN
jgi:hypothetical protein